MSATMKRVANVGGASASGSSSCSGETARKKSALRALAPHSGTENRLTSFNESRFVHGSMHALGSVDEVDDLEGIGLG